MSQNEKGGKTWSPNKMNEIHIKGSKVPKKRVLQDPPTSLSVLSDTELASTCTSSESHFTNTNSRIPLLIGRCGLQSSSSNAQIYLQDLSSSQKTNGDPGLKDNPSKTTSNDTSGPTLGDLVSRHKHLQHISNSANIPKPQATESLALPDSLHSQKSYNCMTMSDVTSGHEQATQVLNISTCTKPTATAPTMDDLIVVHQQGSSGLSTRSMLTKPTGISSPLASINHNGTSSSQKSNSLTTNSPMATHHLTLSDLVLQHQYSTQTSISRTDSSLSQSGTESLSQLARMMDTSLSIHNEPHSSDTIVISSQSSPSMMGLVLSDKSHKCITTSNELRRRKQRVLRRLDKLYFTGSRFNFVTPSPDDHVIKHRKQRFKN